LRIGTEEYKTSSGVNDSGVVEPGYNQAKFMPFEYKKVNGGLACTLSLNKKSEFDITTIADVVLHI
jgi:hypothetical protein